MERERERSGGATGAAGSGSPLVSVITPCHNDGVYLSDALASVRESQYPNLEHIVVDDGSTDPATLEILDGAAAAGVTVLRPGKRGVSGARNFAIRQSSGRYILPLDADDRISPQFIPLAVQRLQSAPELKLVACHYRLFGEKSRSIRVEPYSMERLLGHNLYVVTSLFHRSDFDRVGGFSETMAAGYEDWDFWIRLLKEGGEVAVLEGEHFFYRVKPRKRSRNRQFALQGRGDLRRVMWQNHRELFAQVFPDPLQMTEYLDVANSREYRLGKLLLAPVRRLLELKSSLSGR
ncbi:glycosyltransferase family 2 protein [Geomonas sp. RF6]|uniref:glycosyltransferase family 2 protein n=1 Tax=Geomonas sp. RF6 TaxID=2897342 RepID=UPI001E62CEAB|nr:glycosyltransferase family A protein [Geomonas sp. RF6]UFS71306.1 glycosyltransferase family 2 protein [Geomonas sp. RF6]